MNKVRISLLTIESDHASPELLDAIRELLERSGVQAAVVAAPSAAPVAPASRGGAIAESLMHGSLQELVMDEVTRQPAITVEGLAGAILNDTSKDGVRRVRLAVDPLVTAGRLSRTSTGKLYTPAYAATLPKFQRPETKHPKTQPACPSFPPCVGCRTGAACVSLVKPPTVVEGSEVVTPSTPAPAEQRPVEAAADVAPAPPAHVAPSVPPVVPASRAIALITERPGILATDLARELFGSAKRGDLVRLGRMLSPLALKGTVRRRGEPGSYSYHPGTSAPAASTPVPSPQPATTAPLRVHVPEGDKAPVANPGGRVQGFAAATPAAGSLQERIIAAVEASPGVTIPNLTVSLLGNSSTEARRRIDMTAGPLVMGGLLMRLNGALYPKGYRGPAVSPSSTPTARPKAVATDPFQAARDDARAAYDKIVAAFKKDNACSLPALMVEVFGDSTGRSLQKLQLMLRQLVAAERLEHVSGNEYRPITDKERRGRADDEDDSDDDSEQELESNGAPDDDALEELDLA